MSSLFGFEQQQKKISQNPFRIRIFLFLTYLFRIETINSSYTPVAPLKTIPDSRPKWAKSIPVFRLKRRKDPKYWISGPKRYLDFREMRHRPRYPKNREQSIMGRMQSAHLQRREFFEPCVVKIKIATRCFAQIPCFLHDVAFSVLNQNWNPARFAIIGFTRHLVFKHAVIVLNPLMSQTNYRTFIIIAPVRKPTKMKKHKEILEKQL